MQHFPPRRIVCLTEETVETLYLLGEQDRIVGVSGYLVRPPGVRKEKPRYPPSSRPTFPRSWRSPPIWCSPFPTCRLRSSPSWCGPVSPCAFNQRDVAGILAMIRTLGALVDAGARAGALADGYAQRLDEVATVGRAEIIAPKGLLRGMGRATDQRYRLGVGADRASPAATMFFRISA